MATPVSSLPRNQVSFTVQGEPSPPQEMSQTASPSGDVQDEQALLRAEFASLERAYYEKVQVTNTYQDGARAKAENYEAWERISNFAEKHPEIRWFLPMNPRAPSNDACSVS